MPPGEHGVRGHHTELLLPGEDLLAQHVPAGVEPAPVLVGPLGGHVVRCVGGAGGVVDEERLVRGQGLLLPDPVDRLVGHVLGEVVPLLGRPGRFHGRRSLVDSRVVLVGLAADEPVEVVEAAPARGPGIERPDGAGLPRRYLVALAELRSRVAVQTQRLGHRRTRVRSHRVVTGRRGRQLRDDAHPHRVVVATGQQRGASRRAQRRGVEPVVLQTPGSQPLRRRRVAWATERTRGSEAHVVEQDDEHVRCSRRWPQRLDGREARFRVLRVERQRTGIRPVRDRECLA